MQLETTSLRRPAETPEPQNGPELTVIAPSFNEADNVVPLIEKLTDALDGVHWEVIFVDDNSPDGTSDRVREQARLNSRVRCVQRLGQARADLGLRRSRAHLLGALCRDHRRRFAARRDAAAQDAGRVEKRGGRSCHRQPLHGEEAFRGIYPLPPGHELHRDEARQTILRAELTDPVSGFFMAKREVFEGSIRNLSGIGNKILVDIFASSNRRLKFRDLPYTFPPGCMARASSIRSPFGNISCFSPIRSSAGSFPSGLSCSASWARAV